MFIFSGHKVPKVGKKNQQQKENTAKMNMRGKIAEKKEFSLTDGLGWDQVVGEVRATPSL